MVKVSCDQCRLRCKPLFHQFSPDELAFIGKLKSDQLSLGPNADILVPGEPAKAGNGLFTMFAGWAFRYRVFPDGARQILDFLLPGDLVGLQARQLGVSLDGIKTLTAVSLCVLNGRPLPELYEQHPTLAARLVHTLMQDQQRTDAQLAFLGRRTAAQRMGFLMLDLFDRLDRLGMANGTWCHFPLQRRHLADALGLSGAHVNRSTADLRDAGMATLGNNVLVILDRARLEEFSGYKPSNEGGRLIL
jgi:CRP/FNR family transcriptional regulator